MRVRVSQEPPQPRSAAYTCGSFMACDSTQVLWLELIQVPCVPGLALGAWRALLPLGRVCSALGPTSSAALVSALQGRWSSMANVLTCYCRDVLHKSSKRILSKNRLCMWLLLGNKMIYKNPRSTPQAQLPH